MVLDVAMSQTTRVISRSQTTQVSRTALSRISAFELRWQRPNADPAHQRRDNAFVSNRDRQCTDRDAGANHDHVHAGGILGWNARNARRDQLHDDRHAARQRRPGRRHERQSNARVPVLQLPNGHRRREQAVPRPLGQDLPDAARWHQPSSQRSVDLEQRPRRRHDPAGQASPRRPARGQRSNSSRGPDHLRRLSRGTDTNQNLSDIGEPVRDGVVLRLTPVDNHDTGQSSVNPCA